MAMGYGDLGDADQHLAIPAANRSPRSLGFPALVERARVGE
jgi:hypothetical protein